MYTSDEAYQFSLLLLAVWREARDQSAEAQLGVAWVIRNRVNRQGRFGATYAEVILKPYQFSSFHGPTKDKEGKLVLDANAVKFPLPASDPSFGSCLLAAKRAYDGDSNDPTMGSQFYYDDSMAANPPSWSKVYKPTVKIGALNFFREG